MPAVTRSTLLGALTLALLCGCASPTPSQPAVYQTKGPVVVRSLPAPAPPVPAVAPTLPLAPFDPSLAYEAQIQLDPLHPSPAGAYQLVLSLSETYPAWLFSTYARDGHLYLHVYPRLYDLSRMRATQARVFSLVQTYGPVVRQVLHATEFTLTLHRGTPLPTPGVPRAIELRVEAQAPVTFLGYSSRDTHFHFDVAGQLSPQLTQQVLLLLAKEAKETPSDFTVFYV